MVFLLLFDHYDIEEVNHIVELAIDFHVNEIVPQIQFDSESMEMFLNFLEKLLQCPKVKYVLFNSLENCKNRELVHLLLPSAFD